MYPNSRSSRLAMRHKFFNNACRRSRKKASATLSQPAAAISSMRSELSARTGSRKMSYHRNTVRVAVICRSETVKGKTLSKSDVVANARHSVSGRLAALQLLQSLNESTQLKNMGIIDFTTRIETNNWFTKLINQAFLAHPKKSFFLKNREISLGVAFHDVATPKASGRCRR